MTSVPLLFCLLTQAAPVDEYTLSYDEDRFIVRHANQTVRVPLKLPKTRPAAVVFRRNQTYAVWDDRGLTVRAGKKVQTSRLEAVSVSPRLQRRAEILQTIAQVKKGQRARGANALSGAQRIGSDAFFLVRWEDKGGKPWLEALIRVDLASPKPKPQLVGRFDGLTPSTRTIDDRLELMKGSLAAVTRDVDGWGVASYSLKDRAFDFHRLGDGLVEAGPRGRFVERSDYGTTIGGIVDWSTETRRTLFETRGTARFADDVNPPFAILGTPEGKVLRDLTTGAEEPLPASAGVRRAGSGVVVWSPYDHPREARLLALGRWEPRARWRATP